MALDQKFIEDLVDEWVERLSLESWDIKIVWDEPVEHDVDYARIDPNYLYAKIRLASNWSTWDEDLARRIIGHELLHLVLHDLQQVVDDMEKILGSLVFSVYNARFQYELEEVIDRLATILSNTYVMEEELKEDSDEGEVLNGGS